MHQALYRKWRPQTFEDVCGQDHITSILKYETDKGSFSHAYLFCGSRGTGKTTCAKILAKAVNCTSPLNGSPCGVCEACRSIDSGSATDVLEMDAASNNGVDNIRDIRDEVVYAPNSLKYRVYIIDEVHMLSGSAFNALLKTLEEPPAHVVFILATTELHKLPATVVSRCQRFEFRRIATPVLRDRLLYIAGQEGIEIDEEAATLLAQQAQGGMRDAISLLELCAGTRERITAASVRRTIGLTGRDSLFDTVRCIANKDYDALYERVAEIVRSSMDIDAFWLELIGVFRDMLIVKTTPHYARYLDVSDGEARQLCELSERFSKETILFHRQLLDQAYLTMQGAKALKRATAELTLTRMCDESLNTTSEALLSRMARLEESVVSGGSLTPLKQQTSGAEKTDAPENEPRPVAQKVEKAPPSEPARTIEKAPAAAEAPRPIRNWAEVVERVVQQSAEAGSFLLRARAFTDQKGRVTVRFDNEFYLMMLHQNNNMDILRGALAVCLQREIKEQDIVCEVVLADQLNDGVDELLQSIEQQD